MLEFLDPAFLRGRQSSKWSTYPPDILPSNPAEMDFAVPPAVQQAMESMVAAQRYGYAPRTEASPLARLAEAFSRRMAVRYGWEAPAERTVVLNDLVQAVAATIAAFTEPGEGILLQLPSYPAFLIAIGQCDRRIVANAMRDGGDRFELDTEGLGASLPDDTRLLLLCHPHNPTGRAFSREELRPLAELAVDRDLVVVSDEIHADLVFPGRTHVPFARMFPDLADRTVTLYSATKSFNIPGLRCALMHFGTQSLRDRFHARIPALALGTPGLPGILATLAAWEHGGAWLEALRGVLEANRDHMLARFAAELPRVRMHRPEATYLAWADFGAMALPKRPFDLLLETARVAGGDGRGFGPGFEECVRFNFATSRTILDEKIDRVVRAVRDCRA